MSTVTVDSVDPDTATSVPSNVYAKPVTAEYPVSASAVENVSQVTQILVSDSASVDTVVGALTGELTTVTVGSEIAMEAPVPKLLVPSTVKTMTFVPLNEP